MTCGFFNGVFEKIEEHDGIDRDYNREIDSEVEDFVQKMNRDGYFRINENINCWARKINPIDLMFFTNRDGKCKAEHVRYYPLSVNIDIYVAKNGRVFREWKNGLREIKHTVLDNGHHIVAIPTGLKDEYGRWIYNKKTVANVVLETFDKPRPIVDELKIIEGIGDEVDMYNTKIIAKHLDKDLSNNHISNLKWDFIFRGEEHWNHKLNNEIILKLRKALQGKYLPLNNFIIESRTISDYKKAQNLPDVCDATISNVLNGYTWRVRTEPFAEMTNPKEHLDENIK